LTELGIRGQGPNSPRALVILEEEGAMEFAKHSGAPLNGHRSQHPPVRFTVSRFDKSQTTRERSGMGGTLSLSQLFDVI